MLVMSFVVAIAGYIGYRWLTRGERGSRIGALTTSQAAKADRRTAPGADGADVTVGQPGPVTASSAWPVSAS
jgi:hypothetical protein